MFNSSTESKLAQEEEQQQQAREDAHNLGNNLPEPSKVHVVAGADPRQGWHEVLEDARHCLEVNDRVQSACLGRYGSCLFS